MLMQLLLLHSCVISWNTWWSLNSKTASHRSKVVDMSVWKVQFWVDFWTKLFTSQCGSILTANSMFMRLSA